MNSPWVVQTTIPLGKMHEELDDDDTTEVDFWGPFPDDDEAMSWIDTVQDKQFPPGTMFHVSLIREPWKAYLHEAEYWETDNEAVGE